METDYKRIMRGSREIPISSCPSYIEDAVYSTGPSLKTVGNADVFDVTLDAVDAKAEKLLSYYKKPKKKPVQKQRSRLSKSMAILRTYGLDSSAMTHERVDKENIFCHSGSTYQIVGLPQYELTLDSKEDYYLMDRVICVDISDSETLFYDMSMNQIPSENILKK